MNRIPVTITAVESAEGITLVDMAAEKCFLSAMLVTSNDKSPWLQKGKKASAVFKETEVSLARDPLGSISIRNKLPCVIDHIEKGKLMSVLTLRFGRIDIRSAITTRSVDMLDFKAGDEIIALIKSNEISLLLQKDRNDEP
jgi:molybdate transport system regulatory protein